MKKLIALLLVVLMTICIFSACGSSAGTSNTTSKQPSEKPSEQSSEKPVEPSKSAESVSITIWTNFAEEAELLQKYADMWGEQTGNTAKVTNTSIEVQKFAQAANTADGPDGIYGIANDQLATFVAAGLAAELPADFYNDKDFVNAAVQACYVNGKRYGVPIAVETTSLFYNTDKVKTAPKTWDELLKAAADNGGIKFDATSIYYDLGFIRAFGGYIFNLKDNVYDVKDIGLANEGAIKAYQYIQSMVDAGFLKSDITHDIARSAFENKETAFFIGGPWDVEAFTSAGVNFAVVEMPTLNGNSFITPVGTQIGFLSSKTEKQAAVLDFYKFLMKEAAVELYKAGSRIPASLSVQKEIEVDNNTLGFMNQIAKGEPLPTVAELGQLWTPYSDNMKLMFQGTIKPEEAAKYIVEQFQEGIALMSSGS